MSEINSKNNNTLKKYTYTKETSTLFC